MPNVIFDTIENTDADFALGSSRRRRGVYIEDMEIDCTSGEQREVMEIALGLIEESGEPGAARGEEYPVSGSGGSDLICTRIFLQPVAHDQVRGYLMYEPMISGFGFQPSVYVIRRSTRTITEATNMCPGTRELLTVDYESDDAIIKVKHDVLTIAMRFAVRALEVSVLKAGSPDDGAADYVNYVNDGTWRGLPAGYWLLDQYETQHSVYQGHYSLNAVVLSRLSEPWSYYGIMRHPQTGQYLLSPAEQTYLNELRDLPYEAQKVHKHTPGKGMLRVDPHLTTNFETLFTFA